MLFYVRSVFGRGAVARKTTGMTNFMLRTPRPPYTCRNVDGGYSSQLGDMTVSNLSTFYFNTLSVRVLSKNGEPWFVAGDVCAVLNILNSRDAIRRLDSDEKDAVGISDTIGRVQNTSIISESGLYTLILRCQDALKQGTTAYRFRKWVTCEVLPAIRKTGKYSVTPSKSLPNIEYKRGMYYTFMLEHYPIRAVYRDGTLWFNTHNVCNAFGYKHISRMLRGVAECDQRIMEVYGTQSPMISLEGLYYIGSKRYSAGHSVGVLNSWIARVVLPQILKEGAPRKEDVQKLDAVPQLPLHNIPTIPIPALPANAIGHVRVLTRIDLISGQATSKLVPNSAYVIDSERESSVRSFIYAVHENHYPTILEVITQHYKDLKKVALSR